MMVKILTQKVDLGDLAKVLQCLATISYQVLDYSQLELEEVILSV